MDTPVLNCVNDQVLMSVSIVKLVLNFRLIIKKIKIKVTLKFLNNKN